MAYIKCKNLAVGYEGKPVAEDINMKIEKGNYVCIVGENGAGKSTLMKTLLNLVKPISGEILYEEDYNAYDVGYLPQQTQAQMDFPASVWEIVLSGNLARLKHRPFYGPEEKSRTKKNLKKMDMWDKRQESFRNLSGGQKQRVLLARALCASEKMLVLDEPVSGLDPIVTADFYKLIYKLNQEGLTILMVSHDLKEGLEHATHVLHMGQDKIFFGTKEDYVKSEESRYFV
jgi:zinc transport system ATP-binding protein